VDLVLGKEYRGTPNPRCTWPLLNAALVSRVAHPAAGELGVRLLSLVRRGVAVWLAWFKRLFALGAPQSVPQVQDWERDWVRNAVEIRFAEEHRGAVLAE